MTAYCYSTANLDKFLRTNQECENKATDKAQARNASVGKTLANVPVSTYPVLNVLTLPFLLVDHAGPSDLEIERANCLSANGYDPLVQFVGSKEKTSDDFVKSVEACNPRLDDNKLPDRFLNDHHIVKNLLNDDSKLDVTLRESVDNFVWCLWQNGWMIITQPPWFIDRQKVAKPPRYLPLSEWVYLAENSENSYYYNAKWQYRNNVSIVRTKLLVAKKYEKTPTEAIYNMDIQCSENAFRLTKLKNVERAPWKHIYQDTVAFQLKNKVCGKETELTQTNTSGNGIR